MPLPGSLSSIALGQLGADWIDNTGAVTGDWTVITTLTDTVFTTLTSSSGVLRVNGTPTNSLNSKAVTAGKSLFGRFSAITLASGSVIAYKAV